MLGPISREKKRESWPFLLNTWAFSVGFQAHFGRKDLGEGTALGREISCLEIQMTLSILSSVVNDLLIPQLSPNTLYSFQETILIKNLKRIAHEY